MTEISLDDFATYIEASPIVEQSDSKGIVLTLCSDGAIFLQKTDGKIYQVE